MISLIACAGALRRLFDLTAEDAVLEDGLQAACSGFCLAGYGIPVAPVWLPETELRARLAPAAGETTEPGPRR